MEVSTSNISKPLHSVEEIRENEQEDGSVQTPAID